MIMTDPSPIFLLIDGSEDGPHDVLYIDETLDEKGVDDSVLSCVEGMKAWRSLSETILWSYAKLLNNFRPETQQIVEQMSVHKLEVRDVRVLLMNILSRAGIHKYPDCIQPLVDVLAVNGYLLEHYRQYERGEQEWDRSVFDLWPAQKLTFLGKQQFLRDWQSDWLKVGGNLLRGSMVARKLEQPWFDISDFGYPFPPFSMDQSSWTEEVSFDEASALDLPGLDLPVDPPKIKSFELVGF